MAEKSQATMRMMQNFMMHHENGKCIAEIAKIEGVSIWTIYNNLQEIADNNNVARDSLLEKPMSHYVRVNHTPMHASVDMLKVQQLVDKTLEDANMLSQKIMNVLEGGNSQWQ